MSSRTHHRAALRALALGAALLAAVRSGSAQEGPAGLRAELERERSALAALEAQLARELQDLEGQQAALAKELLEAKLALEQERLQSGGSRADEEREELETKRLIEGFRTALTLAQSGAEGLLVALQETPARAERGDRVRALADELDAALQAVPTDFGADDVWQAAAAAPFGAAIEGWAELLLLYDATLDEGRRAHVSDAHLSTVGGREEDVRLLALGGVRFAYQTKADGRVGLALSSPVDAQGFRWSENLGPESGPQLEQAFAAIASGAGDELYFPLDPTGRIRADSIARQKSMLDQLKNGDVLMIPLGLTALAALILALERFWTLFLRNDRGQKLAYAALADLRQGRLEAALERCRAQQGTVARVLQACLERAEQGSKAMEDAIQQRLLTEVPHLRRFVRSLAILATIAPMLGLLGTVTGIIQTFAVIEAVGNTDPSMMAGGISLALMATLVGLAIAIPTLLVVGLFRGRGDRLLGDAERYSAALLVLLSHGDPTRAAEVSRAG